MELRHLRTFIAVAETLNISEAARRLRATQPALSRQIRALEQAIGRPLFVRAPGRLRLTATGETLHKRSRDIVAAFDTALHSARKAGADADALVRVGYHPTVTVWTGIVAPAVDKLLQKFPHTRYQVVEATCVELLEGIRHGRLDVALLTRGDYGHTPGVVLSVASVAPGLLMVAANHRLAKKRVVPITELCGEEIIGATPEVGPGRERTLIEACRAAGFEPRVSLIASTAPELALAVKQRMAVAMVGSLATAEPHPGYAFIKVTPPVMLERYVARSEFASPLVLRLAELIALQAQRVQQSLEKPVK